MPDPIRTPQPGDPDFDWSQYNRWKSETPDPVAAAKSFLSEPDVVTNRPSNEAAAQTYLSEHGLPTGSAPAVGERRHGATESVEWNGERWVPLAHNVEGETGYHPGAETSPGEAMLHGFMSGASEAATPGKLGALAALSTGGLGLPAAMALGAGGEMAADLGRRSYITPGASNTFGEFLTKGAESGIAPVIQEAIGRLPSVLSKVPAKATGAGGAVLGGYEGYKRGGALGAVEGATLGGAAGAAMPRSIRALTTLFGDVAGPELAAGEDATGFAMQPRYGARGKTINFSGPEADEMITRATSGGSRGSAPTPSAPTPTVPSSPSPTIGVKYANAARMTPAELKELNDFMGGGPTTDELASIRSGIEAPPSRALTPLDQRTPVELPDFSFEGQASYLPGEFPPGPTVGEIPKGRSLPESRPSSGTGVPSTPASLRALERGDEFWGPGSKTRKGDISMADESRRLMYDPQTPTSYLREQLSTATNPAEREYLAKALDQRYRIARRPGKGKQ